ncbi:hypothetical protein SRDD_08130 [Serratia sp. DD3]|nr:hypothetical protein SRDD_08130 [Serratia sp. DD3]
MGPVHHIVILFIVEPGEDLLDHIAVRRTELHSLQIVSLLTVPLPDFLQAHHIRVKLINRCSYLVEQHSVLVHTFHRLAVGQSRLFNTGCLELLIGMQIDTQHRKILRSVITRGINGKKQTILHPYLLRTATKIFCRVSFIIFTLIMRA